MSFAKLRFTERELHDANETWGCNCGPAALAAILRMTLEQVRPHLDDFDQKRYCNVTMMQTWITNCGARVLRKHNAHETRPSQFPLHGLVRIQFTGWWTDEDNWKVAYLNSHWVASRRMQAGTDQGKKVNIFDVNAGVQPFEVWESTTLQSLIKSHEGRTGWYASHRWEVSPIASPG